MAAFANSNGRQSAAPVVGSALPYALRTQAFSAALLDPQAAIPDGIGKDGHAAPKRFAVYRNNVVVSLIEAMRQAYPSLHIIMGDENFTRVARGYIAAHPPHTPVMQEFGREFAAFLEGFRPLAASPFLADVARAERAWLDAWHAADLPVLGGDALAALPAETAGEARLRPHPATALIVSRFPVFDLFNARETWPCPGIDLARSQALLITRPGLHCLVHSLDATDTAFFSALLTGQSLAEAIGEAIDVSGDFDPACAIALAIQGGAFCRVEPN